MMFQLQIEENSTESVLNCKVNVLFLVHLTEDFKGRLALGTDLRLGHWLPFSAVLFGVFPSSALSSNYYSSKILQQFLVTPLYSTAFGERESRLFPDVKQMP